jgi:hypothetical protein
LKPLERRPASPSADARVDADRVGLSVKDGTIVLSGHLPTYSDWWCAVQAEERGEVQWAYQQTEAQRAIRYIEGMHNVSNMITIKPSMPRADDVAEHVSDAIKRMPDLDARSVWVTTSNESVHLHGHVTRSLSGAPPGSQQHRRRGSRASRTRSTSRRHVPAAEPHIYRIARGAINARAPGQ